ncbi:ZIP family metal transporter, partial [Bacillus cereus group sp. Bce025]
KKQLSFLSFLTWASSGFLLITVFTLFAGHH